MAYHKRHSRALIDLNLRSGMLFDVVEHQLDGCKVTMITLLAATPNKTRKVRVSIQNPRSGVSSPIEEPIVQPPGRHAALKSSE